MHCPLDQLSRIDDGDKVGNQAEKIFETNHFFSKPLYNFTFATMTKQSRTNESTRDVIKIFFITGRSGYRKCWKANWLAIYQSFHGRFVLLNGGVALSVQSEKLVKSTRYVAFTSRITDETAVFFNSWILDWW